MITQKRKSRRRNHSIHRRTMRASRLALVENLEARRLLASDWQNRDNTFDVNRDFRVSALDALRSLIEIAQQTVIGEDGALPDRAGFADRPFWDVTGDLRVSALDALRVINVLGRDLVGPLFSIGLENDSGNGVDADSDRVTSDPQIQGRAIDSLGVVNVSAKVDGGNPVALTVQRGESFSFLPNLLSDGSDDGAHEVIFVGRDAKGQESTSDPFRFTLDTVGPTAFSIDLAESFDTAPAGDQITALPAVRLTGQTEPLAKVELLNQSRVSTADALGVFSIANVNLSDGENVFNFRVSDLTGNASEFDQSFTKTDSTAPVITIGLIEDSGLSDNDSITSNPDLAGHVDDLSSIVRLTASIDGSTDADILASLSAGGDLSLPRATLEKIAGGALTDGQHVIEITAEDSVGNIAEAVSLLWTLDTTAPTFDSLSVSDSAVLSPTSELSGRLNSTGAGLGLVTFLFDDHAEMPVAVNLDGSFARTPFAVGISDGTHEVTMTGIDAAGNMTSSSFDVTVDVDADPFRVVNHTPLASADEVGVTFKPQVFFSNSVDISTLTADSFFASFSGQKLPATIVPAGDGSFAWLFFDDQLPSAAKIEVRLVGDTIRNLAGQALDGNGDSAAGGDLVYSFSTVSTQPLLGTSLTGIVMDPGPDLLPHTDDDTSLPGVEVFLLGREDEVKVTDDSGRFTFDAVPGGNIKVEMDGTTATAPDGFYFPIMVSDSHTVPGAVNFVMGMEEMFLPRLRTSILKDVDATQTNMIVADEDAAPELSPEERSKLIVEVPADSLIAPDGSSIPSGKVGISTVPPEIVRDMLPPGILQHTFDITVQAEGISNFARPAPLTIPNKVGAAPGEQINLLSFDHATGRLVIEGTMTVSADGLSATTDPGTGITHPGWHGGTRTGSRIIVGEETEPGDEDPEITATGTSTLFTSGGQESSITITNNGAPRQHRAVTVTVDLPGIEKFAPGLGSSQEIKLSPGQSVTLVLQAEGVSIANLKKMNKASSDGQLYSGKAKITAGSLKVNDMDSQEYFYGEFRSAYKEIEEPGIPFEATINSVTRSKKVDLIGHDKVDFDYQMVVGTDQFTESESGSALNLDFTPTSQDEQEETVVGGFEVKDPEGDVLGQVPLSGTYRPTTQVFINKNDIAEVLKRLADRLLVENDSLVDDETERTEVADGVEARIRELLTKFGSSIQYVTAPGPNTISLNWGSSIEVNWTDDDPDIDHGDGVCDTGQTIPIRGMQVPKCTLRAAIEESNALLGQTRITFGIPTNAPGHDAGTYTIAPESALPIITNPLHIDGFTQAGAAEKPVIEVAGFQAGDDVDALTLHTSNSIIEGLIINRFDGDGIVLEGPNAIANHIYGNYIGPAFNGTEVAGNEGTGIVIRGGATENQIGPDHDSGKPQSQANVIGGNRLGGILIQDSETRDNLVVGNYIGVDVTGLIAQPNGLMGTIDDTSGRDPLFQFRLMDEAFNKGDLVGHTITFLSGLSQGVSAKILTHDGNTITIEEIDTILPGASIFLSTNPDAGDRYVIDGNGVSIENGVSNQVGGKEKSQGNHIAFNFESGVAVTRKTSEENDPAGKGNAIVSNLIHDNLSIGIDLARDGFTTNDNYPFKKGEDIEENEEKKELLESDFDDGANFLLNSPELGVRNDKVEGTLHTNFRNRTFRIEFYQSTYPASNPPHPFATLQGKEFIDAIDVTTDGDGYASFIADKVTKPTETTKVTATATLIGHDGGFEDTSEFSAPARKRKGGVTIVSHGFQLDENGDSLLFMGQEVFNLTGGELIDYDQPTSSFLGFDQVPDAVGPLLTTSSDYIKRTDTKPVGTLSTDPMDHERILVFDWASESNNDSAGWGEHAGDVLFAMMVDLDLLDPFAAKHPDYHFIAHSMGTAVISETMERMAKYNVMVQHATYLDAHDFDQSFLPIDRRAELYTLGLPQFPEETLFNNENGYGATRWENIKFLDAYYEVRGTNDGGLAPDIAVPLGRPILGAYNYLTADGKQLPIALNDPYRETPGSAGGDHSYIHNMFYLGTVRAALPTLNDDGDPVSDVQRPQDRNVEKDFATTGFAFSRNAIFPQKMKPKPIFFKDDTRDEPQGHEETSRLIADADGTPNADGLAKLNNFYGFSGPNDVDVVVEAITDAKFKPQYDPLTIYNGNFSIGHNGGALTVLFNDDELPGWNFQGGGGITIDDVDKTGNQFSPNYFLTLESGETATHNIMYVPTASDLRLSLELERVDAASSVRISLGDSLTRFIDVPVEVGFFESSSVAVPADLMNTAQFLEIEAIGGDVRIDRIRFTSAAGVVLPPPRSEGELIGPDVAGGEDSSAESIDAQAEGEHDPTKITRRADGPLGESDPSPPYADNLVVGGDGVDNAGLLYGVALDAPLINSHAVRNFLLANATNKSHRTNVGIHTDRHLVTDKVITRADLIKALAATAVHEIAHTLGAVNTGVVVGFNGEVPVIHGAVAGGVDTDIMLAGLVDLKGDLGFKDGLSEDLVKVGLAGPWDRSDAANAIGVVAEHIEKAGTQIFSSANHHVLIEGEEFEESGALVFAGDGAFLPDQTLVFQDDFVIEPGSSPVIESISVSVVGSTPRVLSSIEVIDPSGSFTVSAPPPGTIVGSGDDRLPVDVSFLPTTVTGLIEAEVKLVFGTGDDPLLIDVVGTAVSSVADLQIDIPNNNVGGQGVDDGAKTVSFGVIRNAGQADLSITAIAAGTQSAGQFQFGGLPANLSEATPLVIPAGGAVPFEIIFDPNEAGIQNQIFHVSSDDPDGAGSTFSVVGTGIGAVPASDANNYILYEAPYGGPQSLLRTMSDAGGNFELFVAAQQFFRVSFFDPISGLIGQLFDVTHPSGQSTPVNTPVYRASDSTDKDMDGLSDEIEEIVGTDATKIDTNGDGVGDFDALQSGLDPLAGLPAAGIIGAVKLSGEALGVTIDASASNPESRFAYVATGSSGLAIIDVTTEPVVLSETELNGESRGVAVDRASAIAIVAAGPAGVHFLNVEDPTRPVLLSTLLEPAGASFVEIFDGRAFVTASDTLYDIDLVTFEITDRETLGGGEISGIARSGSTLVLQDAAKMLRTFRASSDGIEPLGALQLVNGGGQVSLANDIVYVTVPTEQSGGFSTVDISDPTAPALLGDSNSQPGVSLARTDIAPNGSGTAVLVGDLTGAGAGFVADVFDVSDPAVTTNLVTTFSLQEDPKDIVIADATAFIAGGLGGLQILNYLSFDNQGQAPEITISTPLADADPGEPGFQVLEGTTVPVDVNVDDDLQVKNVDLLANGRTIIRDFSAPFEVSAIALSDTGTTLELQGRATDTGGNAGLSNTLVIDIIPDLFAPRVVSVTPVDNAISGQGLRRVRVEFSESMSQQGIAEFINLSNGTTTISPLDVSLRDDDRTVVLTYDPLPPGSYDLKISGPDVKDRAGNPLGPDEFVSSFTLAEFTNQWIGTDGFWDDPANWSEARIPNETDVVLIDVPGDRVITYRTTFGNSTATVAGIISNENFLIESGNLIVTGASEFSELNVPNGTFTSNATTTVETLTLSGLQTTITTNDVINVTGTAAISGGNVNGVGELNNTGEITLTGISSLLATLNNSSMVIDQSERWTITGAGVFNNLVDGIYDWHSDGTIDDGNQGPGEVNNSGLFMKSMGTEVSTVRVPLNNVGRVEVKTGTVSQLNGGTSTDAVFHVEPDAELLFSGGGIIGIGGVFLLEGENMFSGGGTVRNRTGVGGGTFISVPNGSTATFDLPGSTFIQSGSIDIEGTVINLGDAIFDGSELLGTGSFVNRGDIEVTGFASQIKEATLDNESMIRQTLTGNYNLSNGGTIINRAGATYDLQSSGGITTNASDSSTLFDNQGLFKKSAGDPSFISVLASNSGQIDVQATELVIRRNTTHQDTTITIQDGAKLHFEGSTQEFSGTNSVSGDGAFESGGTLNANGPMTINLPIGGFEQRNVLNAIDSVVLDGMTLWSTGSINGNVTNRGTLEIAGTQLHSLRDAVLNNEGDILQSGSRLDFFSSVLNNIAGATYELTTDGVFNTSFGSTQHEFNNAGTFTKSDGSATTGFAADFLNTGTASFQAGTTNFTRGYVQTSGSTEFTGGDLGGNRDFDIQAGDLSGAGTISGNVILGGNLNPGGAIQAGTITITGTYEQTADGELNIEIGGNAVGESDQVVVGTAVGSQSTTLDGTLNVSLIGGFTPQLNDSYETIVYDQVIGDHATKNGFVINGSLSFQDQLTANAQTLTVVQSLKLQLPNETPPTGIAALTASDVEPILAAAIERLANVGLSERDAAILRDVQVDIVDLPENQLGRAGGNRIMLDATAAGFGWYIDLTPPDDEEFSDNGDLDSLFATAGTLAHGRVDLLTAVTHELAHLLGAGHDSDTGHLLSEELSISTRHRLDPETLDELFAR